MEGPLKPKNRQPRWRVWTRPGGPPLKEINDHATIRVNLLDTS